MTQPSTPLDRSLQSVSFDFGTTASTATVFTQHGGAATAMDPDHVQKVREDIVSMIEEGWPDEELHRQFVTEALERLGAQFPKLKNDDLEQQADAGESELKQLVRWIESESPDDRAGHDRTNPPRAKVLDAAWVYLAQFIIRQKEPLRTWGSLRLHEIVHQALHKPAFIRNNLALVPLEGATPQVDSVLRVRGKDIGAAELTSASPQRAADDLFFRALKRRILKPVPLPAELGRSGSENSDVLIGQAYRFLEKKVVEFAATELRAPGSHLSTVVVTYPTTTPPAVRRRLHELVSSQLAADKVVMRFDEGVAALMFVLMRDFGGDDESGIETFRARSRMVGAAHWRQNLLVVDIGGGTTDIALTRLDLRSITEAVDREWEATHKSGPDGAVEGSPRIRGRVYVLRPEVLGSTGHQQYGGDLLTLRVFYWIKACIADAVREQVSGKTGGEEALDGWPVTPGGEPVRLARAVADYPDPGPGPRDVVRYLREALPTRSPDGQRDTQAHGPQLTPAFDQLWQTALEAKRILAQNAPYDLEGTELTKIATALGGGWKTHIAALAAGAAGTEPLRLTVEDFGRLAGAVLRPALELAVDLAWRRLEDQPGELLDGIALTGRAAGIPLVRELLLEQLASVFGAGNRDRENSGRERGRGREPMAWNPALVTTEHDHPKGAASIGACWAQAKYEHGQKGSDIAASPQYQAGRDQLLINVSNMVVNLPCRFGLGTASGDPIPLLGHGRRLEYSDGRGRRFTRTDWLAGQPDITLLRFLDQRRYIQWGHYNIEGRWHITSPPGLRYQIEIDDELVPTLHMCMGAIPRFALDGSWYDLSSDVPPGCRNADGTIKSLPWELRVLATDETTGEEGWRTVLPAIPTVTSDSFPYGFVPLNAALAPVPAAITGELPPPKPPRAGSAVLQPEYLFAGFIPGASEPEWVKSVLSTQARGPAGQPAQDWQDVPHWAVLDVSGKLYLPEPGYPRYQQAADVPMMLGMPGSVFSTPMEESQPDLDPDWDPFTGEH